MNLIAAPVCTSTFLVGDAQCDQIQHLLRGSKTPVLALGSQTSALAAISAGLLQQREAGHPVGTLHLIAHGRPGTFRIGDQWIDAEALKAHSSDLARWGVETIALWSCHLGADANFVALLEELTGAQVVASAGWLGRDDEGVEQLQMGPWSLADITEPSAWPASFRLATVPYDEITAELLRQRLTARSDDLLLLDVRPLESSEADAIEGAVRIPWPSIDSGDSLEQVRALAGDKDLHVICQKGGWSAKSSQFLADLGIAVTNVMGGMDAWVATEALSSSPQSIFKESDSDAKQEINVTALSEDCPYEELRYEVVSKSNTDSTGIQLKLEVEGDDASVSSYLQVSKDGELWTDYRPGYLEKPNNEGKLQVRVFRGDLQNAGIKFPANVSLEAQKIVSVGGGLVWDANYSTMNLDGAEYVSGPLKKPTDNISLGANRSGVFEYRDLLDTDFGKIGARVTWTATEGVEKLIFDKWNGNDGKAERFQPVIKTKNSSSSNGGTVHYKWEFFGVNNESNQLNESMPVALGRFKMNPIDLDGESNKTEIFDVDLSAGNAEASLSDHKPLVTFSDTNNVDPTTLPIGWTRFSGANHTCNGLCPKDKDCKTGYKPQDYSASINYFGAVSSLEFQYGGKGKNFGSNNGSARLFSVSFGEDIVAGLTEPSLRPVKDSASINVGCQFAIKATGACLNDATGEKNDVRFSFEVKFEEALETEQELNYAFIGEGFPGDESYEDLRIYVNGALLEKAPSVDENGHVSGTFTAEVGTELIEVWAEATAKEGVEVSGSESLKLVVNSGLYQDSDTASVAAEDCPPPVPGVESNDFAIKATGACLNDATGEKNDVRFSFEVKFEEALETEQELNYAFIGEGFPGDESYEDLRIYVNGALLEKAPSVDENGHVSGTFTAEVGTELIEVWAEATAKEGVEVSGSESLKLVVNSGLYQDSDTASVAAEDCPPPVPGVESNDFAIKATGACLNDATGEKNDVRFSFEVKFEEALETEQELNYAFIGEGFPGDESYEDLRIYVNGALLEKAPSVDENGHVSGTFTAEVGTELIEVWAEATAKEGVEVSGSESLKLVVNSGLYQDSDTASVAAEDCPPPVPGVESNDFAIKATGACLNDATGEKNDVRFSFEVKFEEALETEQELNYAFIGEGFPGDESYEDLRIYVNGALLEKAPSVDENGHVSGTFTAEVGTELIEVWAEATAKEGVEVSGSESLKLVVNSGLYQDSDTASVAAEDCPPPVPGVESNDFAIKATGACLNDATGEKNDVRFSFEVKFEEALETEQELNYAFIGEGFPGDESYEDLRIYVNGALLEKAPSVDENGHVSGTFTAEVGTELIEVWAEATAKEGVEVSGSESLKLVVNSGLYQDSDTASVAAEDCPPKEPAFSSFTLTAAGACLDATESPEVVAAFKADDCDCSSMKMMASPEASLALEGSDLADDLDGGSDDDDPDGGAGDDDLLGSAGDDELDGGAGDDELDGGFGVDVISGGVGQDELDGGAGDDVLNGGEGNDLIDGGEGDDLLSGGSGSDDFKISGGNDIIKDFNPLDFDKIVLPPAPLLPPGQMPVFTQDGKDVSIRYQDWKTIVENALLEDVVIAAKADLCSFTFTVQSEGLGAVFDETFFYQFSSNKSLSNYQIVSAQLTSPFANQSIDLDTSTSTGEFAVDAGWTEFRIDVQVQANEGLSGDEALTLSLTKDAQVATATADLSDLDCLPEPELPPDPTPEPPVLDVDGVAACEISETASPTDATFTFSVERSPANEEETYSYNFTASGLAADGYSIDAITINSGGVTVLTPGDESGQVQVAAGVSAFDVQVKVKANEALSGQESLTLDLGDESGTANLSLLGCEKEPEPPAEVLDIDGRAACVIEGVSNGRDAIFAYAVTFDPSSSDAEFNYDFRADGLAVDGYSLDVSYSTPSGLVSSTDLDQASKQGVIKVGPDVTRLDVEVRATATTQLTNNESLTFTIGDESHTATLGTEDCQVNAPDGTLYLLMDRSTSMLGSDPSTSDASIDNRLEAQNRTAFASFLQAATKAGYGFRLKGDSNFQLFGEQTLDAITNNGSLALADALKDYELVDLPDDGRLAGELTVELISFGYVVGHEIVTFTEEDPITGLEIADAILLNTTPDQIYGNSIDGNPVWSERGLPQPDDRDLFRGDGSLSSNLYAGTELLGAMVGLEHRVNQQLLSGKTGVDDFTFVTLTTDGRPERRQWWDNRAGDGSGVNVALPPVLGGDAISSSGLLYDNNGTPVLIAGIDGVQLWPVMQGQLNGALDQLASGMADPGSQLQVRAIGTGDGSDANFPAIYGDLLANRLFSSGGSWSYDWSGSYQLPDFAG